MSHAANMVPLEKLGEIISGSTPNTNIKDYWNGDIPWITPADLTKHEGIYFKGSLRKITKAGYNSCSTRMLPPGSIIFSSRAPIGHCAVTAFPLCTNQGFKSIVPNENLDSVYGFFALTFFTPQIIARGRGATFLEVSKDIIEDFRIPLPPLPEQKRIVAILEKADRLRGLRRYALELSDTYLQSVFLEMFGEYLDMETPSRFSSILERPLRNGVFVKNDKYGLGTPVIWVDNLYHTISIETERLRRAELSQKEIARFEVFEGDLLFTRSSLVREGVGQVNIVRKLAETTTFECHTIQARVKTDVVDPYYVLALYRSTFGKTAILQKSKTATMTTIGQEDLGEVPCPIPPIDKQHEYARVVQKFEHLRVQQREAERQAEHLFQTLLRRTFRGELS